MSEEKLIHNEPARFEKLSVIYQDEHLVAINKPNRLLVHKTKIAEEKHFFANRLLADQIGCEVYPVHRIDRATSGVLLFAYSPQGVAMTQSLFMKGNVTKEYLAVVRGFVAETGSTNEPLIKHETGVEQTALTNYERLHTIEVDISVNKYPTSRYSLVRMLPKTGRTHQLRRHFNHMGHPIVGDTKYGDLRHNRMFEREWGITSLLLHAYKLTFIHPFSNKELSLQAPLSPDFVKAIDTFGWQHNY
ncbi:pseudouridine synthase [uncultured Imperialibacter sp.]|uniref:pseudouridine synthase n=1 Tax=uncultured Imperialibacter sp. TaxID=1672639 RepID=UPI0030DD84D7|tara:strand:- start:432 stop:1169 length:738 start_codon:yes stop_codon:yes gene_type:complete